MADPNMLFEVFNVFEFWFNTLQLELLEFNCFDFSSGEISQLDSSRGGDCCKAFNGSQLSFRIMPMVMILMLIRIMIIMLIMLLMLNMVMIMMLIMIMIMPMMISMLIRTMIMMLIMSSLIVIPSNTRVALSL